MLPSGCLRLTGALGGVKIALGYSLLPLGRRGLRRSFPASHCSGLPCASALPTQHAPSMPRGSVRTGLACNGGSNSHHLMLTGLSAWGSRAAKEATADDHGDEAKK